MSFAIRPFILGAPHRIDLLERLLDNLLARDGLAFMHGDEIAKWSLGTASNV
jgi:allantoinase